MTIVKKSTRNQPMPQPRVKIKDLPVSRQYVWRLRRVAQGKCGICGRQNLHYGHYCRAHYIVQILASRNRKRRLTGKLPSAVLPRTLTPMPEPQRKRTIVQAALRLRQLGVSL